MSPTWFLGFFALIAYTESANGFLEAENRFITVSPPSNLSHLTSSSNRSSTPSNALFDNALDIKCNGTKYGDNLNIADCKDAKTFILSGSDQIPWVQRFTLFPSPHFFVPYRYMGGKSRDPHSLVSCFAKIEQIRDYVIFSST